MTNWRVLLSAMKVLLIHERKLTYRHLLALLVDTLEALLGQPSVARPRVHDDGHGGAGELNRAGELNIKGVVEVLDSVPSVAVAEVDALLVDSGVSQSPRVQRRLGLGGALGERHHVVGDIQAGAALRGGDRREVDAEAAGHSLGDRRGREGHGDDGSGSHLVVSVFVTRREQQWVSTKMEEKDEATGTAIFLTGAPSSCLYHRTSSHLVCSICE
jgi:hypothetical protein